MNNPEVYISIIVTILGIAFPILLQIISRLDDRYYSNTIIYIFNEEIKTKVIIGILVISILSVVLWTIQLPPAKGFGWLEDSASWFVAGTSILLIIVLVIAANRILKFYTARRLSQHLIKQREKLKNPELSEAYFQALSDIFILSIKQDRPSIVKLISDYLYSQYKDIRVKADGFVEYPQSYTTLILRSTEILAKNKVATFQFVNYRGVGGVWLLGESGDYKISNNTYWVLWRALKIAIEYNRIDMILFYWSNAHQYYSYNLSTKNYLQHAQGDEDDTNDRRLYFLYFNAYLGGLLLQSKKYDCLQQMFDYTQSYPPHNELIPSNMHEFYELFIGFQKKFAFDELGSTLFTFDFPNQIGMLGDQKTHKTVSLYLTILYLRLWKGRARYGGPINLVYRLDPGEDRPAWIRNLKYLKYLVNEIQDRNELKEALNVDNITQETCAEQNKPVPQNEIDDLIRFLNRLTENEKINLSIPGDYIEIFKSSSVEILSPIFQTLQAISSERVIRKPENVLYVHGGTTIMEKEVFMNMINPELNGTANVVADYGFKKIADATNNIFESRQTKHYIAKKEDIKKILAKMEVRAKKHVIINFGFAADEIGNIGIPTDIKLVNVKNRNGNFISRNMYIMPLDSLPTITITEISADLVERYNLTKSTDYNLYMTVVDLNENADKTNDIVGEYTEEKRKSVYLAAIFNLEYKWRKNSEVVRIEEHTFFKDENILTEISTIKKVRK